jgi:eukaryotic-like serine/threonine-protein kinase
MVDGAVLLGRYRLERRVAAGGMGAVFEGIDERLHRRVAVKVLREEFSDDPRFVERFRREARAVALLSHPHIARVYDYGEEGGRPFIIMELVPGHDLAHVLSIEAPLNVDRAVNIGTQLCEALGHAHSSGVIHRDVKPANIIVADGDQIRVTDFGIARAVGDSTLTATGSIMGTANYLSPEQAQGHALTPASDLYSVGVVLYEMLTGTVPLTADSDIAVAMRHMNEDVPPPSALNPRVPPQLDAVVAHATQRAPTDRARSAQELADSLREVASAGPQIRGSFSRDRTLVAGRRAAASPPPPQGVWPVPSNRLNSRLGRLALLSLLGLALVAGCLLGFRLLTEDDPDRKGNPAGGAAQGEQEAPGDAEPATESSDEPTATPTESPAGVLISEDFIGAGSKDVEKLLESHGVLVETIDQDSDAEKHTVLDVDPPPGTTVAEGDTVTLIVSTGKVSDEEEEEGDD